jgi:MFS family permease
MSTSNAKSQRMTPTLWAVCIIAAIGFAFDTYELLMLPLVARDALLQLGGPTFTPGSEQFTKWFGLLFYVPAVCGGIFGLLGGYLTDRLGRRRVLTWSILLYAFSAFAAGYATSLPMLLLFRTTTFVGVCVEFVAATAWLAELFDDPEQRERVLGYTQGFSSLGGILVAIVNGLIQENLTPLHDVFGSLAPAGPPAAWRYTLMSGLIPALPLIVIRPFLPESPKWIERRAAGTLRRPSIRELFSPELKRTTIITTIMVACSYAVAFGAIQQLQQIVPGIDTVQAKMQAASAEKAPPEAARAAAGVRTVAAANYTKSQEFGGLAGRFALAMLVVQIASRRNLLRAFVVPGLLVVPAAFWLFSRGHEQVFVEWDMGWLPGFHHVSISMLGIAIFLAGFFTVAQFSFWGNYLPRAYPVHLRGTGESFAANIGGRMFGTPFAFLTQQIVSNIAADGAAPPQIALITAKVAAGVALVLFLVNLVLSFKLPEQTLSGGDAHP